MTGMRRFPVGPSVMAAGMLAILVALGVWQIRRLAWKEQILAAIDRAETASAVALPADPARFQKVFVVGEYRAGIAAIYGDEVRDGVQGGELVMPLFRGGADPVLVDRGFVAAGAAVPVPNGTVRVRGFVRRADRRRWFSPRDDGRGRHFYTLDPTAIGAALGLARVAPFCLVALGPDTDGLKPATHLPRPDNNHLQYALTWFGLALVLVVQYGIWLRGYRRRSA